MKRHILLVLFLAALPALAQNVNRDKLALLAEIEKNNTTLATLRQKVITEKAENGIGNALPDPKVGFENSWGNQPNATAKQNISVEQELDWGTLSGRKNKATERKNDIADLNFLIERQKLLAEADQLIVNLIYANALCEEMSFRELKAADLKSLYEKKYAMGDANQLELNKVRINHIAIVAELKQARAMRDKIKRNLERMNGNQPFRFDHTEYPATENITLEEYLRLANSKAPQIEILEAKIEAAKQQLKIDKAEGLPSLSIGYTGEFTQGDKSNGFTLAMSIPVWGNSRKKVNHQRSAVTLAEMEKADMKEQIRATLTLQYQNAYSLDITTQKFKEQLNKNEDIEILDRALELGQISLIEYLNEISFYYSARTQLIETEKESQLAISEMWKMLR